MKYLIIALVLMLSGCASAFEEQAYWPDKAYGGPLEKVALEGYREHHSRWLTPLNTSPNSRNTMANMHINPEPTASCVTHSIWTAAELEKRGIKYEVVLLRTIDDLWHSVIKVGDVALEINTREPYPYEQHRSISEGELKLVNVNSKNLGETLTKLGYTYK